MKKAQTFIAVLAGISMTLTSCIDEKSLTGDYSGTQFGADFEITLTQESIDNMGIAKGTWVKVSEATTAVYGLEEGSTSTSEGTWRADLSWYDSCPQSKGKEQCVTLYLKKANGRQDVFSCRRGWFGWKMAEYNSEGRKVSWFN